MEPTTKVSGGEVAGEHTRQSLALPLESGQPTLGTKSLSTIYQRFVHAVDRPVVDLHMLEASDLASNIVCEKSLGR